MTPGGKRGIHLPADSPAMNLIPAHVCVFLPHADFRAPMAPKDEPRPWSNQGKQLDTVVPCKVRDAHLAP